MNSIPEVGVVVVNYHMNKSCTQLASDILGAQGVSPNNLIIVDNSANTDLKLGLATLLDFKNVVVANNIGYGSAMNLGVGLLPANVSTVVLLTHEVVLQEFAIRNLAMELASRPEVSVLGPTLMKISDGEIWSVGGSFSGLRKIPYHLKTASEAAQNQISWLDGACLVLLRETWNQIGGFDSGFFLYFEDIDLCLRSSSITGKPVSVSNKVFVWQEPSGNLTPKIIDESFPYLLIKFGNYAAVFAWIFVRCLSTARSILNRSRTPNSYLSIFKGVSKGIRYRKRIKNHGR